MSLNAEPRRRLKWSRGLRARVHSNGMGVMGTFYVYRLDSLEYLGAVEATDGETAGQLAGAVWPVAMKVLSFRLMLADRVAV